MRIAVIGSLPEVQKECVSGYLTGVPALSVALPRTLAHPRAQHAQLVLPYRFARTVGRG